MDYISMNVEGTVISTPVRKDKDYIFKLRNERGNYFADFEVIVKNDERPIDINKGDKVNIFNAGFFVRNDINCLAIVATSHLSVQRVRCNYGEKEV